MGMCCPFWQLEIFNAVPAADFSLLISATNPPHFPLGNGFHKTCFVIISKWKFQQREEISLGCRGESYIITVIITVIKMHDA
jgi:hypothetical protein